jgi:hypothetical protein
MGAYVQDSVKGEGARTACEFYIEERQQFER